MIEQLTPPPSRVSLFEAVLARWLVEMTGVQFQLDDYRSHVRLLPTSAAEAPAADVPVADAPVAEEPSTTSDACTESVGDADARHSDPDSGHGLEVDDRFPALGRFGRLLEVGAGHLEAARAAYAVQGRQASVQARQLAAFAAARPATLLDLPDDEVGSAAAASRGARPAALTEVSEWAVDEVMAAFALTSRVASGLLADSITLTERLPATLDALEAGLISWAHARMLAEVVGPVNDVVRAGVEARLLSRASGKTVSQLRQAAHRAVLAADAAAHTKRLAAAIRERSVRAYPGLDGMGTLAATMPVPLLEACRATLRAYAEACATPGDERTLDQRMLDCLADLILRGGQSDLPAVQAQLTIVATAATLAGGDEPGEVNGQPVSALEIRELAYALGLLPRPADAQPSVAVQAVQAVPGEPDGAPEADDAATTGRDLQPGPVLDRDSEAAVVGAAVAELSPGAAAAEPPLSLNQASTAGLGQLLALRSTVGTSLAELPQVAIVDELSGQLLALTNGTGIRHAATCHHPTCRSGKRPCVHPPAGTGLGPPPPTAGYSPSAPLARFVRARDRRCRFPGCRAAAIRCDLDHNQPWPAGATSADNLCCLCRHHHRLSHQAPGWTMTRLPDGGMHWTTPGGQTVTTHPIGYGTDDDLPPSTADQPTESATAGATKPLGFLEQLRRWPPPPPPDPDAEPAPF